MSKKTSCERRDFLKMSVAGAAALTLTGPLIKKAHAGTGLTWPDTGTMAINPDIDNLRVVVCNDPTMIKSGTVGTFQLFNNAMDTEKLQTNMDKMAMALAQKPDAKTAWATIFRKPAGKTWSQVKVAIKINCVDVSDQPRLAIVDKICRVLNVIGTQPSDTGVPFANISLYDSRDTSQFATTYAKTKLPAGIIAAQNMGSSTTYALPKGNVRLLAGNLNTGSIDILINLALNKGHDQFDKGKTTLCMKNHYGTFEPQPAPYPKPDNCGNLDYLLDINKSTPILGGTPPRQQLCIIDSLWAMEGGPTGGTMVQNNRIVMGTFAGAVDYLTARKIRQTVMKIPVGAVSSGNAMNDAAINRYLTGFGYDLTAANVKNLDFVDALTWTPPTGVSGESRHRISGVSLEIVVANSALKSTNFRFSLPHAVSAVDIAILDMKGRIVRRLAGNPITVNHSAIVWDGRSDAGKTVAPGNYIVKLAGEGFEKTGKISISK